MVTGLVPKVFSALKDQDIFCCVWKSLENIDEMLNGVDDFDLYVPPNQRILFENEIKKHGFREDKFSPDAHGDRIKVFRSICLEDFLHITFHVHFGLWFGSKKIKEYQFTDQKLIRENTYWSQGIPLLNRRLFALLRLFLFIVKEKRDDQFFLEVIMGTSFLSKEERFWVQTQINGSGFSFFRFRNGRINTSELSRKICEKYPNLIVRKTITGDEKRKTISQKMINDFIPNLISGKRNKICKPIEIYLIGIDGAGKSSAADDLVRILKKVAMVKKIYLGRKYWSFLNQNIDKARKNRLGRFLNILWYPFSTTELLCRQLIGKILVRGGCICIFDRNLWDLELKWGKQNFISRVINRLAPRTSHHKIYFFLDCAPEIALKRAEIGKHDLSELIWNKNFYTQKLAELDSNNVYRIDSGLSSKREVIGQMTKIIYTND